MTASEVHSVFYDVPAADAPVWRYMSFAKLTSLLQTRELRFTRVDRFDDHFEGVWPRKDLDMWNRISPLPAGITEEMRKFRVAASCWVDLKYESAGMWRLYAPGNEGVAIKTTFAKLRGLMKQITAAVRHSVADAGRVQYVDHANDSLLEPLGKNEPLPTAIKPFMLKHVSYEHEREVRALVIMPLGGPHRIEPSGYPVPLSSLDLFIEEVVTSPLSEPWFEDTVQRLAGGYGIPSVRCSELHRRRFWQSTDPPEHVPIV